MKIWGRWGLDPQTISPPSLRGEICAMASSDRLALGCLLLALELSRRVTWKAIWSRVKCREISGIFIQGGAPKIVLVGLYTIITPMKYIGISTINHGIFMGFSWRFLLEFDWSSMGCHVRPVKQQSQPALKMHSWILLNLWLIELLHFFKSIANQKRI